MRNLSMLLLALAMFKPAVADDAEAKKGADDYNLLRRRIILTTADVLTKFGQAYRVSWSLRECKLDALADTIEPSKNQIDDIVVDELVKQNVGKEMIFTVMAGVSSAIIYNGIGYTYASESMHRLDGDKYCQLVTVQANKMLRDKSAAK